MQTIFVGTDRTGKVYPYTENPEWDAKNGDFSGPWRFENCEPSFAPPPGECREYQLVPVGEADAKDARISELEKQPAERSPGVMPEVVEYLVKLAEGSRIEDDRAAAYRVREYYAQPDGHEWQCVDAEHPITADDVGRKVWRCGEVLLGDGVRNGTWVRIEKVYILRPIAKPFAFAGEPGRYRVEYGCNASQIVDLVCADGLLWVRFHGHWRQVSADGTFAGGEITGRV